MNTKSIKHISSIENLIEDSKMFLKQMNQVNPYGIIIRTRNAEGKDNSTILFKQQKYVLIVPQGIQRRAFLYGNWEEALYASKRLLSLNNTLQDNIEVSIDQYFS